MAAVGDPRSGAAASRCSGSRSSLGRVGEGLVEGTGAVTAACSRVGTMAGSLGPTVFGHLPDALALFAALIVGSRASRPRGLGLGRASSPGSGCCSSTRPALAGA